MSLPRLSKAEKRARKERARKVGKQQKEAAFRGKFGPRGKPAPVVFKTLDGEVIGVNERGNPKVRRESR